MILITGARGFIGRHLAAWLLGQGREVVGIGHGSWIGEDVGGLALKGWVSGDICADNLARLQNQWGVPQTIYHLAGGASVGAAFADPAGDFSKTVTSTSILLEWMRTRAPNASLVAVSSAAVYGAGHDGLIREDAALGPYSPYGYHKLMMEILCRSYAANFGLRVVLPRLFSVFGTGLRKQLLWDLCNKFASREAIELGGSGDELRDWTHVEDVVQGLESLSALADNHAPTLNLATGVGTPVRDIASLVAACWETKSAPREIDFDGQARIGDPFSLVADVTQTHSKGISCTRSVEEGIPEYVEWFRARPDFQ